jgi:SAM-dependent methyltransferase
MQSSEEWGSRNRVMSEALCELVLGHAPTNARRGLDVGCQGGAITDRYAELTGFDWVGIDPMLPEERSSPGGRRLYPATADRLPFDDGRFDVIMLANVYEHIVPERRVASFREMQRVLAPNGVVVGQIPNPYFPIESHSRLPFMGWLPIRLRRAYWRLTPAPWVHDFFVVTPSHLRRDAAAGGFRTAVVRNFNYPPEAIPRAVRTVAKALERPMRSFPWAWQFVLVRNERDA